MAEIIHGDANANQLNARADNAQVYGLKGNDTLTSSDRRDVLLVGGSGDDSLIMSGGNGTLSGGEGSDTFELTYSATKKLSAIIEDLDPANDKIIINYDGDTAPQLTTTTGTSDVVLSDGEWLSVTMKGVRDNDYFDGDVKDEAWEVLKFTNAEREAQGLSPLTMADGLTTGASIRAKEITSLGTLGLLTDHRRPGDDGKPDDDKLYDTVFKEVGKTYWHHAENLDGGAATPQEVVAQWMSSDSHKEHILDATYKKIGIGYNYDDPDPTNHRYYWTQLFGDSLTSPAPETVDVSSASPQLNTVSKAVTLTEGGDTYNNTAYGMTIVAKGGNDSIANANLNVSISGGADKDTVDNRGSFATICAGTGDDLINLGASTKENVIEYALGDGNDTVNGFHASDTLSVTGSEYTPATVGNNVVVAVGTDSVTLADAAQIDRLNISGTRSKLFILTDAAENYSNNTDDATIAALGGDDTVTNGDGDYFRYAYVNVSIDGGNGNDRIANYEGHNSTLLGGEGNDTIRNYFANNVTIAGGAGDDSIQNDVGYSVTADGGQGNDTINNVSNEVTILGGAGDDSVYNNGSSISIDAGTGDDSISSNGDSITIDAGDGNDSINVDGKNITIDGGNGSDTILGNDRSNNSISILGGAGNDSIYNLRGTSITLDGGAGNDTLRNSDSDVTINGGKGNDTIANSGDNVTFLYSAGDGRDTAGGFNATSTLSIGSGTDSYSAETIGNDILVKVGAGSVLLTGAARLSTVNIRGTEREPVEADDPITLTESPDTYSNTSDGAMILALGGGDSITLAGDNATIYGGSGNDVIEDIGSNNVINGGLGDDSINFADDAENNLIEYSAGDGNDIVNGFKATDSLSFADGNYTGSTVGNDVVFNVGTGSITLRDAATLPINVMTAQGDSAEEDKLKRLTEGDDTYSNTIGGATILALGGNDNISNIAAQVSISGGDGKDSVSNRGSNVTIDGGAGDDSIRSYNTNVSISVGEGDDTVWNMESNVTIDGGAGADTVENFGASVSISVGEGNDSVLNWYGENVTLNGGAGDDTIENDAAKATINAGDGYDSINSSGANTSITGGAGDDTVDTRGDNVTLDAGTGNDNITNGGANTTILGGEGNDFVTNSGNDATIDAGAGDDTVDTWGINTSIAGGDGNDSIRNWSGYGGDDSNVTIAGGAGDDTISNDSAARNTSIAGGDGNDLIENKALNVSIEGNAGDDIISLSGNGAGSFINYTAGDGNDILWGYTANTTLNIAGAKYVTTYSGDDIVYTVGNGSITLKDARDKPLPIIIGESGTSGGGSDSGNDGDNSSGGKGGIGDGSGVSSGIGGNTSGGTSASEGNSSAASGGGRSASGSAGRSVSNRGGNSFRRNEHSTTTDATTVTTSTATTNPLTQSTPSTQQTSTATQQVYTGGNQVVSDYASGQRIVFGTTYTGAFFDGNGNFFAGSTTGALVVQNAADKVIDLTDAAGNSFVKAYAATTAGVIDGRGLAGFEVINGSAGSDAIYAGDGCSQLWGGADTVSDAMLGGGGTDIFIGGKNQGADFFLNASTADVVHLNDSTLSDIVATAEENGTIGIAFNTGNVVAVQSSEALSATVMLADGSAYRFNHANKSWQSA